MSFGFVRAATPGLVHIEPTACDDCPLRRASYCRHPARDVDTSAGYPRIVFGRRLDDCPLERQKVVVGLPDETAT